jgi:putative transcriptional regulator
MTTIAGQFLLASPRMIDGNFARCVVLMIQHDDESAMGVIVNRPTSVDLTDGDLPPGLGGLLFAGGPCPGPLMAIHTHVSASQIEVAQGVHFTADPEHLAWLAAHGDDPLRIIVGYAGWSPGQLEGEITRDDWMVTPATGEAVFSNDPNLWSKLVRPRLTDIGLPSTHPGAIPSDPSVN